MAGVESLSLRRLLEEAYARGASDIHLRAGQPPLWRVDGEITAGEPPPLTEAVIAEFIDGLDEAAETDKLRRCGQLDCAAVAPPAGRARVHAFKQADGLSVVVRALPPEPPVFEDLLLPPVVKTLADKRGGLVLATGSAGSGKSTTLAALLDHINAVRRAHIITLEDPIEYVHRSKRSVVSQREVGRDVTSFAAGLKAALRADPDVILVGELRSRPEIAAAITAAQTGHLVLATLHAGSAWQAVSRLVSVFPAAWQVHIRLLLSLTLQGVVNQRLVKSVAGRRIPAAEVLTASPAMQNIIREGKDQQLVSVMQSNAALGMQTMAMALAALRDNGIISAAEFKNQQS